MSDLQGSKAFRLASLKELEILDTPQDREFDALVKAAACVCGTSMSLISLIDNERQWFKARKGLEDVTETSCEVAFCAHTIKQDGIFEINDATTDPRFVANPLVTGSPNIRFYAGATLRLSNGARIGTLCVIDKDPKQLTDQQRDILQHLSTAVVQMLEARRMTRDLATSEKQFRALGAAAPLGVYRTNAHGACICTNEQWQAIFDLRPSEAMGHGWSATLHPDDKESVFKQWHDTAKSHNGLDMEFRIQHSDNEVKVVRTISRPFINDIGEVSDHVGSVEDITVRVNMQQILIKEQRRLQSIIEGTGTGTWEWNIQTGETRFNDLWANMVGLTLDQVQPSTIQTWDELVHPEDTEASDALLNQHLQGNSEVYDCELRLHHRQGHWIWVHLRGRVLTHQGNGKPEWMFGTQLDITARKEQEQALLKSEWLLAETGELANVGGWELDLTSNIVHWTTQTCRIHGMPENYKPQLEEAIGFYTPEARPAIKNVIQQAINEGRPWDIELPLMQKGGDTIWVRSVGHVEYDHGTPKRLIGALQNITDRVLQRQALENAHERINVATESGKIGVWEWDIDNGELTWTSQMYSLYGLTPDSNITNHDLWAKHIHPDDRVSAMQTLKQATGASIGGLDLEFRAIWPDGSVHFIQASSNITRKTDGTVDRMIGVNWDVTPLRTLSNQLAEQHELLQVTLQSIGDAVITTNPSGHVTWMNPASESLTGWLSEKAIGIPLNQVFNIIEEETRRPAKNPLQTCLGHIKKEENKGKTILVSRHGTEFGIEESAAPIKSKEGILLGLVLVFHDVTEQRRLTREMNYRATHDALTGLTNRSEFETHLKSSLYKAIDENREHALMYIDLDQFKLINDACGHSQGDLLLVQIAKLLRQTMRPGDTLARLGGDEFGVILQDCSTDQARTLAQMLCDRMNEFRFEHEQRRFRIGSSIGLVPLDKRWTDIESVMQAADTACRTAKEAGRNRVHMWFDTDKAMHARRKDMQWAARLEQALDEDKFILFAQRIETFANGDSGIHAEVLIRLRDSDGKIILPNAFLPAAERFNLATRIDRWVLEHSLNVLSGLPDISTTEMLCINLSGQSVSDRVFHNEAVQLLKNAGSNICQRICLEITETAAVTNIADATAFIVKVRALGVRIALDDFGSGASSFGYLKSLPVDILKIDGQFITGVIDDPLDDVAVRCFVDISRVMNLKTVAECVESQSVLDSLGTIGVDYTQGFFMHKPEPIEKVLNCSANLLALADP